MAPNFGEKRIYNNVPRSSHSGIDIAAPFGSPARASNSGRVVLARDLYFSGKTVIIDHGLGLFTYYCHFSRLKVSRGEAVEKGSVIALTGSTGRSTGPHLHWGVRLHGSRVDPAALLGLELPK
jgi:murein DD-endopeptidase MepM/ murein hydrolase activator NlpD